MIQFTSHGDYGNWVDNKWFDSSSEYRISVISPYFDKQIATIPDSGKSDLDIAVEKAKSASRASGRSVRRVDSSEAIS